MCRISLHQTNSILLSYPEQYCRPHKGKISKWLASSQSALWWLQYENKKVVLEKMNDAIVLRVCNKTTLEKSTWLKTIKYPYELIKLN